MTWNIDLTDLKKGRHRIETLDGSLREGKITGLNTRGIEVAGKTVQMPTSLELNNESMDTIDWNIIRSITRLARKVA